MLIYFRRILSFHSMRLSLLTLAIKHGQSQEWILKFWRSTQVALVYSCKRLAHLSKDECKALSTSKFKWNYNLPFKDQNIGQSGLDKTYIKSHSNIKDLYFYATFESKDVVAIKETPLQVSLENYVNLVLRHSSHWLQNKMKIYDLRYYSQVTKCFSVLVLTLNVIVVFFFKKRKNIQYITLITLIPTSKLN